MSEEIVVYCHDLSLIDCDENSFIDFDEIIVKDKDIVTMELNLKKKILKLFVNEQENLEHFKVEINDELEYKMAINLDDAASVEIINFETFF